jgi:hypothetical protein
LVERLAAALTERASFQPARPASPWMTASEAGGYLRPDAPARGRRVYELVGDGRLGRFGDGRRLLVRRDEVERLATGGDRALTLTAGSRVDSGIPRVLRESRSSDIPRRHIARHSVRPVTVVVLA